MIKWCCLMIIKQGEFEMNEISKRSNWKDGISTHYPFSDDMVFFDTKRIKIEKEMENALQKMDDEHFYVFCDGKIIYEVKYEQKETEFQSFIIKNGRIEHREKDSDTGEIVTISSHLIPDPTSGYQVFQNYLFVVYKGKILEKTYIRKDNGKYYTVIRIDGKYISNDSYEFATRELSCGSLSSIDGILECGINFEEYVWLFSRNAKIESNQCQTARRKVENER